LVAFAVTLASDGSDQAMMGRPSSFTSLPSRMSCRIVSGDASTYDTQIGEHTDTASSIALTSPIALRT
jgi:hypothetical protein